MMTNDLFENQDVIIENGRVVSISDIKNTDYNKVLNFEGKDKYMMPSLADAHVHFPDNEMDLERMLKLYLINGVTKLHSMRGDWKHRDWKQKYNTTGSIYPKLYLSPLPISINYGLSVSQINDYVRHLKIMVLIL